METEAASSGRWVLGGLVSAAILLTAPVANGTHDVGHRYVVLGYVRDERGRPIERSRVLVLREKTRFSYRSETDADGFYVVIVHLHDEDVLEWLQVTAGQATIRVDARFNPLDQERARGTRVDFRGRQTQERSEVFIETIREVLEGR